MVRNGALVGATGGLSLLAGCAGGGDEPRPALKVVKTNIREGESGALVVEATVENSGDAKGSGTLYLTVTAAESASGNETADDGTAATDATREKVPVTVAAGETETVTVEFEFTYDQFVRKGSINSDIRDLDE
ncbi:hypothetical protein M0R88_11830 [Halorussus gelatinilyticus]|uniref:CARDB domain-containing protein n=1 Tax=Halorussus gelatinilyticus TaxID=2937524 RepID=A0A8U0IEP5_9EURY|nr:hypothetical protein [Halorussus gelatinilyticus]UPV99214.1 hypothetical protein M0R88_11830 [Halorussus gelatinilyticus]